MATNEYGFELDEDDTIKAYPLAGYTVARVENLCCLIKFDYALTEGDRLQEKVQSVQVAMTAEQLRELGHILLRNADVLESDQTSFNH